MNYEFDFKKVMTPQKPWEGKIDPFKIIGNVYFCGTYQASSHLIDTGEGLIIIDTGYADTLYLVIRSIYELGYNPKDIKYIINTHWHKDHVEATAAMAELSGAKTLIGRKDEEKANKYFIPDILIDDGYVLALGNTEISFIETPGHTRGTVSFFFNVTEDGKTYRVGMFGGAGVNVMVNEKLKYDGCADDFRNSLNRLRKEKVDVFIGNHVWNNDTFTKAKILKETGENKFIDDKIWNRFLDNREKELERILSN